MEKTLTVKMANDYMMTGRGLTFSQLAELNNRSVAQYRADRWAWVTQREGLALGSRLRAEFRQTFLGPINSAEEIHFDRYSPRAE